MLNPHALDLNLTIAADDQDWTDWKEVTVFLKDRDAGWEISGIGRTFLEAIANLIGAIEQMTIVPPDVKAQLLRGGIQLSVMPWGDGSAVQGKENPLDPAQGGEPTAWWLRQ
jgi:hypothetical protein